MRAMFMAALGILALAALSGCDLIHAPTPRTAAIAQPCNCLPAPAEHLTRLAPPEQHYRHHHHYRDVARGYGRSSHSYREYESAEMAQYEYVSSSTVSSSSAYSGGYITDSEDDYSDQRGYRGGEYEHDYWTDGYGRRHYSGGSATRVAADDGKRLDPWHAYNTHCRDRDRD